MRLTTSSSPRWTTPLANNPFGIQAVSFRTVNYSTTVPLPDGEQIFQVSGALLIPEGLPVEDLQGVIVYFHGTTFAKNAVPSNPAITTRPASAEDIWRSAGFSAGLLGGEGTSGV